VVTYLSGGIAAYFTDHGLSDERNPAKHWRVLKTLKGLRRRLGLLGEGEAEPAEALDMELLELMLGDLKAGRMMNERGSQPVSRFEARQARILMAGGFAGLLRRGEMARLRIGRVTVDGGGRSRWTVSGPGTPAKGDQDCRGQTVQLPAIVAGDEIGELIREHKQELRTMGLGDGDLFFRNVLRPRTSGWHPDGEAVLKALRRFVGQTIERHGLQRAAVKKYSAHSLRRGGAQWLRDLGVSRDLVKLHGRWKSDAVDAYFVGVSRETEARLADLFGVRQTPAWANGGRAKQE
jgi:integrase